MLKYTPTCFGPCRVMHGKKVKIIYDTVCSGNAMSSVNSIKNLESLKKSNKKYIFNSKVVSPPVALKLLSYSNTFLTKLLQFLIIFFLKMTTHCSIYVHRHSQMLLICNMLSVGLLFKAPLEQTWEMLSFYNYIL
jgi:hypothetical protein